MSKTFTYDVSLCGVTVQTDIDLDSVDEAEAERIVARVIRDTLSERGDLTTIVDQWELVEEQDG